MKHLLSFFIVLMVLPCEAQLVDTLVLKSKHSVFFASDEWDIEDGEKMKMDSLLEEFIQSDSIVLEGHTDKVGSLSYNQKLSAKRVKSVLDYFLSKGVPSEKFKTSKFGELQPAVKGDDESVYKWNRRVEIQFFNIEKRRKLKGKVEEEEKKTPLLAKVKITGKNFSDSVYTTLDGNFSILVPDNGVYKLEISAENHFFEQRFIKVSASEPDEFNVGLPEVKVGSIYTLPNFNFKGDLPILLPRSVPTLDLLYELLDESDICIEIKGHINLPNQDSCAKDTRHYKLSVARANMVYRKMVDGGIDSLRMLPRGYGNWEMLFPKATTEKDMVKNRRVEIKIIDCQSEELISKSTH